MSEPTCLYVITDDAGACKVGVSRSPQRRLRQLQTGASTRLRLARFADEPHILGSEVEAYTHWLLREAQMEGEWFKVTPDAAWVALVAAVVAVSMGNRFLDDLQRDGRGYSFEVIRAKLMLAEKLESKTFRRRSSIGLATGISPDGGINMGADLGKLKDLFGEPQVIQWGDREITIAQGLSTLWPGFTIEPEPA